MLNSIQENLLKDVDISKEDTSNIFVQLNDAYERGKVDINFFAGLCMPTVCIYELPIFYIAVWYLITQSKDDLEFANSLQRFCLGLPRSHAKTTFIKILIVWMIAYDKASFILVVCSSSPLADNLLADIDDILGSDNITSVYGEWESTLAIDSADTKKAAYHGRSVILCARGWAAGIRGINLKNERPDFIFCDDVQTKQNYESITDRAKLLNELVATIFKAIAPRGHRVIVYVGNMYGEDCILDLFRKNKAWTSLITGAILATGQPLWPALFSLEELKESYEHDESLGLATLWFAEIMNDPQSASVSLLPFPLPESDIQEIVDHDGAFITIDPAGFRTASDDNVIALHFKYNNIGYSGNIIKGKEIIDPSDLVCQALLMALDNNVTLIGIESVAYQQTLCFWFNFFMEKLSITHITIVELHPHGRSKESRIRQYVAELYKKTWFILHPKTRREFNWQGGLYKLGKKGNKDDLLDAEAYAIDVRNEYWHLITNITPKHNIDRTKLRVKAFNTPF